MASMLRPLLRNELAKALRRKLTYLGVLAVAAMPTLFYLAARHMEGREQFTGWSFLQASLQLNAANVELMFVAIFCAALVAEERGSGTIRVILAAPVRRWEFYLAKTATGLLYTIVLTLVALAVSVGLAMLRYSFGDITDEYGVIYPVREVLANFALAFSLDWLSLAAVAGFGLFVSTLARNGGQAIGAAIGVGVLMVATAPLLGFSPYTFTTYVGAGWHTFGQITSGVDYAWKPEIWRMILVPAGYALAFFTTGLAVLLRRDLNG